MMEPMFLRRPGSQKIHLRANSAPNQVWSTACGLVGSMEPASGPVTCRNCQATDAWAEEAKCLQQKIEPTDRVDLDRARFRVPVTSCPGRHIRAKVPVASKFVMCTSGRGWSSHSYSSVSGLGHGIGYEGEKGQKPEKNDKIDLGVYLDSGWIEDVGWIWSNCPADIESIPQVSSILYPALYIPWRDMGVVDTRVLQKVVPYLCDMMWRGRIIEIGCAGGHGRTGTLLACMIAYSEQAEAEDAVTWTRQRYCPKAIETKAQEEAVAKFVEATGGNDAKGQP